MTVRLPSNEEGRGLREAAVSFGQGVFSVREETGQTLAAGDNRIVNFDTEEYNPDGWFLFTPDFRYLPKKPGYYLFTCSLYAETARSALAAMSLFVNGVSARNIAVAGSGKTLVGSCIHYMNGSTDYAQIAVNPVTDDFVLDDATGRNFFQGVLISTKKQ
jgi:hypothetical protein